jgi:hypothetical protein
VVVVAAAAEGVVGQEATGSGAGRGMTTPGVRGEGRAGVCASGWCVLAVCSTQEGPRTAVQVAAAA